jgi:hypothetical protein
MAIHEPTLEFLHGPYSHSAGGHPNDEPSPHFSQGFYCGGGSGHVYSDSGIRNQESGINDIHAHLRRFAMKTL